MLPPVADVGRARRSRMAQTLQGLEGLLQRWFCTKTQQTSHLRTAESSEEPTSSSTPPKTPVLGLSRQMKSSSVMALKAALQGHADFTHPGEQPSASSVTPTSGFPSHTLQQNWTAPQRGGGRVCSEAENGWRRGECVNL